MMLLIIVVKAQNQNHLSLKKRISMMLIQGMRKLRVESRRTKKLLEKEKMKIK